MAAPRTAPLPALGRLGFSEEQGDLLEMADRFCRERSPIGAVRNLLADDLGYDPAVWTEFGELGWLGVALPESAGGSDLGLAAVVPIVEQMGRRLMATPFVSTTLAGQAILWGGTPAQKAAVLPAIAEGAATTLALAESAGDWTPDAISCEAIETGQGQLKLSGHKLLVEHAASAQWIVVSVRHRGAPALLLLERSQIPDAALRRETVVDETRRSFELTLDGLSVPASCLMDASSARATLDRLHLAANLLLSAEMCGGARAAVDLIVDYLKTRKQFGRLIGSYQALKHPTVEAYVRLEQARSHLYSAAHTFTQQGAAEISVRMAKATADWAFSFASDRAIQFHGGFGFTYDCDAQLYRRRAIWCASQHGDGAWHKQKLADLLL